MLVWIPTLPILVMPETNEPVRLIDPNDSVPNPLFPAGSDSNWNVLFRILISWSVLYGSVGVKINVFLPLESIFVEKLPNFLSENDEYFSKRNELVPPPLDWYINSDNWTASVSGSTIWIKYLTWFSESEITSISENRSWNPLLENLSLISSWIRTLFVLHSV